MSQIQTQNKAHNLTIEDGSANNIEHETPMPSGQFVAYQLRASLLIFLFYVYCAIAVVIGALTGLTFAIIALRVPYSWSVAVVIGSILKIFCQSLRIGSGADFNIKLTREEAPEFFNDVEHLSKKLDVAPPNEIILESGPNAYVQLLGFTTGAGKTKLGFGFDFLAGLDKNKARAILAHEMAHAKHVKRGYQGFLMRGLVRLSNSEHALQAIANYPDNSSLAKYTAKAFVFIPKLLVKRTAKLISACSRYDEFLADRVAAQLVGPQAMKDALLATYVIDHQGERLSWRERILHLNRTPGYTAWLEKQFQVPDDEKRLEIEGRAIERAERSEFSTHPALPDRLKALDNIEGELNLAFPHDDSSAVAWLINPDATAKRLLGEMESVAAKQEAKATKQLAKEGKKFSGQNEQNSNTSLAILFFVIGVFLLLVSCFFIFQGMAASQEGGIVISLFLIGGLCLGLGVFTINTRKQGVSRIPIPTFSAYRAAQHTIKNNQKLFQKRELLEGERNARVSQTLENEDLNAAYGQEIRAHLPIGKPKAQIIAAVNAAHIALGECNYKKALVASRIAFDLEATNPDALLIYSVTNTAIYGGDFSSYLNLAREQRNGWNANWATAWMLCLINATESAETILLGLSQQKPSSACIWALLGYCQAMNEKPREALNSRRRSLQLSQEAGDVEDEACHRFVLAQNLTALGQLDEAQPHLEWLRNYAQNGEIKAFERISLDLEILRFDMAMGEEAKALEAAKHIGDQYPEPSQQIRLGQVLNESREKVFMDAAETYFYKALETGFYPEAKFALSGIEYERENKLKARELIVESLDCLRERPNDASHPLSFLSGAVDGMRILDDRKPVKVSGYEVHLEMEKAGLKLTDAEIEKISLLCFASNIDEAKVLAMDAFGALFPNRELVHLLNANSAPENFQPHEPIPSGIYSCRWE
jgi:Zn-dependent protease with chaperone function